MGVLLTKISGAVIGFIALMSAGFTNAQSINAGGLGMQKCHVILERVIRDVYYVEAIAEWVAGYISGANVMHIVSNNRYKDASILLKGSHGQIAKELISRCRSSPNELAIKFVEDMYVSLPAKEWE